MDEPASQFQAGGERLRLLDAVAEKLEEAAETRLPFDKRGKARFRGGEPGERLLFEEGAVGVRIEIGDEFD